VLVTAALAIELTSWLLLKRAKQVAQNRRALERSGERIREGSRSLPPMFRRHPCLVTACALVVPSAPSVLAAAFASGARPGFMLIALALSVLTQGAFFVVHWSRIGAGLRWLTWVACTVPALLGLIALLTALDFAAAGRPWSGVAVAAAFVVPTMTSLSSVRGPSAVSLSLRDAAVWLEVADAVNSRRRALRRLDELTGSASDGDEALLLEWLQRSR
jgi:hypothetical protein